MKPASPSLKTLIAWADQARAGHEPPECARWRAEAAADELFRWERVVEGLEHFDQARWPDEEPTLSAELVAAYIDDCLDADETSTVEQTCFASPADLFEVISECRFAASLAFAAPPIAAPVAPPIAAIEPEAPPVSRQQVFTEPAANTPLRPVFVKPARPQGVRSANRYRRLATWMYWTAGGVGALAAVALVVLFILGSSKTSQPTGMGPASLAGDGDSPSKNQQTRPSFDPSAPPKTRPTRPEQHPEGIVQQGPNDRSNSPSIDVTPSPDSIARPQPTPSVPPDVPPRVPPRRRPQASVDTVAQPTPPKPMAPTNPPAPNSPTLPTPPASLTIKSDLGLALAPGDSIGEWRVAKGELPLVQPLTLVSLADSWSTAEVVGVGTLVLAGDTKATISRDMDQVLRVSLEHGQLGIRDLAESTRVRMEAGGETWSTRGIDAYSTLAVVRDESSAGVYVSSGIIAIDDTSVSSGQASLVQSGMPSVPRSVQARVSSSSSAFVSDPYDVRWLQAPDEKRKRDWQLLYGKLAEQLASSDDVMTTMRQLRESVRDGRQHAMLARWNLSLADDRASTLWEMLRDRQKSVRLVATQELLSIPPRDGRLRAFFPTVRAATDQSTAAMVLEWVGRSHRNTTLTPANARELVEGLGHQDPAVRQVAVFLLEHYSQDALAAARLRPPSFDARDTVAKRTVAQSQWRTLAAQIFANRNRGAAANKAMP